VLSASSTLPTHAEALGLAATAPTVASMSVSTRAVMALTLGECKDW